MSRAVRIYDALAGDCISISKTWSTSPLNTTAGGPNARFITVETLAQDLDTPWGIAFMDDRRILITERPGRLRIMLNGTLLNDPVAGTPSVLNEGQGGLLDVAVDPQFQTNGWIYLAYSHALPTSPGQHRAPAMTRIVRGRITDHSWTDQEVLFEAPHDTYRTTRHHYGCRIV